MNENERDFESQKVSQGDKGPTLQSKKPKTRSQDQEAVVAALKESEERYKAIFERQLEAVYICDFEGNFIDANPAALNMLGYDKEEIRSLDFEAMITPTQIPKAFETLKEIIETGSHKELKEYRLRHKDGHYIDIETKGSLIYRNGEPYAIQGTARDITERKKTEAQIMEQNRFLTNVLESLSHPFYVINAHDYTVETANTTAKSAGIVVGEKCHLTSHGSSVPCESEGHPCPLSEIKQTKEPVICEHEHIGPEGEKLYAEVHAHPIFDSEGEVDKIIEYTLDITDRKKSIESLVHERDLMETLFDNHTDFIYFKDAEARFYKVSKRFCGFFGLSKEEIIGKTDLELFPKELAEQTHTEDLQVIKTGTPLINKEESTGGTWVLTTKLPWYDKEGKIIGLFGISRDITDLKKADENIKLQSELLNQSSEFIISADLSGKITYANLAMANALGFTPSELIGQSVNMFPDEQGEISNMEVIEKTITEGQWEGERAMELKDGSKKIIDLHTQLIKDSEGQPNGLFAVGRDITDKKKAEEALIKSEKRLRRFYDSDLAGFARTRISDGKLLDVNDYMVKLLGYENKETCLKEYVGSEHFVDTDGRQNMLAQLKETGVARNLEISITRRDGSEIWVSNSGVLYPEDDYIEFVISDITERMTVQEALQYRLAYEELLASISTHFINLKSEEIDDGIDEALERIGKFVGVDRSYIFLLHDGNKISNTNEWCAEDIEPQKDQLQKLDQENFKWMIDQIRSGLLDVPSVADIPEEAGSEKQVLKSGNIKSLITVPILIGGSMIGFLGFDSVRKKRTWSKDTLQLIKMTTEIFANGLERTRSEQALRESEERYRLLFENSLEGISITKGSTIISANKALLDIYGYESFEEYAEIPLLDHLAPESKKLAIKRFKERQNGEFVPPRNEYKILRKDGEIRDIDVSTTEMSIEKEIYIQATIRDVTERTLAEKALKESESRLRTAQHIAHLGFWEWDLKTSELYWSDEAYHIFGLEVDKVNPTYDDFLEILHPQDKESVVEAVDAAMHGKSDFNVDHRIILPSGLERYVTSQGELIRDEKGTPIKMMGTMIDITDRKKAEKETKKRNEELYTLNTISSTINQTLELKEVLSEALEETISVLNVEGGLIYLADRSSNNFSPAIYYGFSKGAIDSISGFSIGEGISGQAAQLGVPLFVPNLSEDAQHISSAFLQDGWDSLVSVPLNSKGKVVGVMTVSSREKNKFKPEDIGLLRSIGNQIGVAIENARLYSFSQDELAERRRAEKKVSQQNKFLKSVLESLTHPFYVVNVNNNLIEVANSAARARGLTVGSACNDIKESKDNIVSANGYFCPIDDIKQTKEPKTVEHFFYDETGNMKYNEVHAYPIFDEKGEVKRVIEYAVDITDRKRAEAGLKERDAQLRSVVTAAPIALWSLDKEGKFTLSEGKALDALGQKPGQVVGESVYDVYRDAPQILDDNKRALKGEEFSSSLVLGDLVWETYFSPLKDQKGKVMGTIGVATDITKRRRAESEREILFRELKHRVKNNLQLLSSMVDMQILRSDNKAVRDKLQEIQSVIDTIALIYTRAYEGSKLVGLNLNNFIEEIITASMKFKVDDKLHISHTITGDQIKLNTDQALPMALIANELVFNALKHAFSGKKTGNITVSLKKVDGHFTMSIADDGVGMNPEIDLKKPDSFGLKIIKNLIEQLNGTIETVVDGGTEFIIRIPMEDGE